MTVILAILNVSGRSFASRERDGYVHNEANAVTTMKRTLRRWMLGVGLLLAGVGWFAPAIVSAQDAAPKSGVVTTTSGSNRVLEYGMVIVMFGAALFAVCRSSRRNV